MLAAPRCLVQLAATKDTDWMTLPADVVVFTRQGSYLGECYAAQAKPLRLVVSLQHGEKRRCCAAFGVKLLGVLADHLQQVGGRLI